MVKPIHPYETKFREFLRESKEEDEELKEASVQVKQVVFPFGTGNVPVKAVLTPGELLAVYHKDVDGKPFRFSINLDGAKNSMYPCVVNDLIFWMDKKIVDRVVDDLE